MPAFVVKAMMKPVRALPICMCTATILPPLEGEIGVRVSQDLGILFGAVTFDAKAAFVHDFTNSPVSVAASMGGGFVS